MEKDPTPKREINVKEQMALGCKSLKEEINKMKFTSGRSFLPSHGMTKEQFDK